jgi:outer membrane protein assembly factor BamA
MNPNIVRNFDKLLKALFFLTILLLNATWANAQDQENDKEKTRQKKERKVSIVPLPAVAADPTSGLILGIAPAFSWTIGNPETTSMSTAIGLGLVTTKRQLYTSLRSHAFLKDDSYTIYTDFRFNINNQPTYGLGTKIWARPWRNEPTNGEKDDLIKEMIFFRHIRLYGIAMKRYQDTRFFYGLGFHFDRMFRIDDRSLNLGSDPPELTYHEVYQREKKLPAENYQQSGISLNALYDSRDNVANPYKGKYLYASWRSFAEFLGSTSNSGTLWLEYRDYFSLSKNRPRNILALWTYAWSVTHGEVSYMFLPAVGWDMFSRSGRAYTQGRFRGEDLVYTELEWRFPLQKNKERFGSVLFANTSTASSRGEDINLFSHFQLGYGLGLRYMVLPKRRINIALDYGFGVRGASGIFLNVNEMF